MKDLADLVAERRAELGLSLRDVADRSGGLISKTHAAKIEQGILHLPSERVLRGLALALELPVERVLGAADRTAWKLPPFQLPEKANRLTSRERKLVLDLVHALLAARDGQ